MSESPKQSRKPHPSMLMAMSQMFFMQNVDRLPTPQIRGTHYGSPEFSPRWGKFKGHHREHRRSKFKRTHQKR